MKNNKFFTNIRQKFKRNPNHFNPSKKYGTRYLNKKDKIDIKISIYMLIITFFSLITSICAIYISWNANNKSNEAAQSIAENQIKSSNESAQKDIETKEAHNRINEELNKIVSNLERATNSLAESTKEIKNISEQQVGIANKIAHFSEQQTLFASQQTDFAKQQVEFSKTNTIIAKKTYNISEANLEIIPLDTAYLIPRKNIIQFNPIAGEYDYNILFMCNISNSSSIPISVLKIYLKINNSDAEIEKRTTEVVSFIFDDIPCIITPVHINKLVEESIFVESQDSFSIDPFKTYQNALFFFPTYTFIPNKEKFDAKIFLETNRGMFTEDIEIKRIDEIDKDIGYYFEKKNNFYNKTISNYEKQIPNSFKKFLREFLTKKHN